MRYLGVNITFPIDKMYALNGPKLLKTKMNNGVTDKCWHGCAMNGTLIHLLWHCPETQTFWLKIRDYLCKLFEINFLLDPAVGLLGKQREQPQKNLQYSIYPDITLTMTSHFVHFCLLNCI
uniref:Uncharacterized protein n=1 Tax=Sparus aurata TaxID=8175 RepID=A0A671UBI7_SPAAU